MKTNLIARAHECAKLQRCMESDRSELVIVYGRRRVGKTYLIDEYFDRTYDFSCSGVHHGPKAMQLRNFAKHIKSVTGSNTLPKFGDWMDAFDALEEYLEKLPDDRKKVLFFDEMPWMDTGKSDFVIALENFWNGWASRRKDIVLIATGSATSWMIDKMVDNHGGLHARVTCHLYLRQFTLGDTEEYLRKRGCKWDRYQILQCYMVTGGVPYYLSILDVGASVAQNIDQLFFAEKAELKNEFADLYSALFRNAERYIEVVRILNDNKKGLTREEIGKLYPYPNDGLTQIIYNLEQCDFIKSTAQFNKGAKLKVYQLVDFFTIFYYKFIKDNLSGNETWWTDNMNGPQITSWSGLAFERLCMAHVKEIKSALGISGVPTEISTWKKSKTGESDGAQIDLIIKRMDRMLHLCEMKFSTGKYNITADYERRLRERQSIFEQSNKSHYGVLHTFVTTYGVSNGKNKSIVHSEVTMDDLFRRNH